MIKIDIKRNKCIFCDFHSKYEIDLFNIFQILKTDDDYNTHILMNEFIYLEQYYNFDEDLCSFTFKSDGASKKWYFNITILKDKHRIKKLKKILNGK